MYRMTMFFTSDRNSWSETHLFPLASQRAESEVRSLGIAQSRAALLGTNARIIGLRVSSVGGARDARLIDLGAPTLEAPNFTNPTEGQTTADSPHVAVLVRGFGTDTQGAIHQKHVYLSGVPDQLITVRGSSPELKLTPQWATRFAAYKSALTGNSCGFLVTRPNEQRNVNSLVISNVPPGEIGLVVDSLPSGTVVGGTVFLNSFKRRTVYSPPLGGAYQVSAIVPPAAPATTYTIFLRNVTGIDPASFFSLGHVYTKVSEAILYQELAPVSATHRDRGGSYGLQRGKSRVKKR